MYALDEDAGLLLVNSPTVERGAAHAASADGRSSDPDYADDDGLLRQCMHCRRFRRRGDGDRWDWIPTWADTCPRPTSHGICPTCFVFRYGSP